MTFIASTPVLGAFGFPIAALRKSGKSRSVLRSGDEEGARRALGADGHLPVLARPGRSLEDLARIALG